MITSSNAEKAFDKIKTILKNKISQQTRCKINFLNLINDIILKLILNIIFRGEIFNFLHYEWEYGKDVLLLILFNILI